MNTRFKIASAAALGLLVATGAAADAATITKTKTVTHATRPVVAKKTVTISHRFHRPLRAHLAGIRVLPGHRLAPRIHVAHAATRKVVKTTVVR